MDKAGRGTTLMAFHRMSGATGDGRDTRETPADED
jgi:hypothetical protein